MMEPLSLLLNPLSLPIILLTFSLLFSLSLSNPDTTALLTFKSSSDTSNTLSSWSNSSNSNHCSWFGVTCDPSTHRVIKLVVDNLNLTGSIQPLTRLTHLRHLSLHHNRLSFAPPSFTSWPNLKHLYLAHNLLAGEFPAGVVSLRRLRRLDLSYNRFSGEIPMTELTQMTHLLTLRLDSNSFTGNLDSGKFSSTSISEFNVSNNDLTGKIPNWVSKFPVTSFSGNVYLCGKPLPENCPNRPISNNSTVGSDSVQMSPSNISRNKNLSDKMMLLIIIGDAIAIMATLVMVTCYCYRRKYSYTEREKGGGGKMVRSVGRKRSGDAMMVCFEGCKGFAMVDELLKASAEMLGKGSVGTTYKVVMEGGDVVVVKRVRERRKRKDIDGFLRDIGGLRHTNVVGLRAYYSSWDELLLVYDFLPNGSLHSLLHGNRGPGRTPLDWTTRLKIAAGSAGGIGFIHSFKSKLFHGHLTASNILVDQLGNACISDIGLHQLFQIPSSPNNGYNAPELMLDQDNNGNQNRKLSQKSDVYSFGVILLEILTGKMVTSEGEASLVNWVRKVVGEEWTWEVFDFELLRYKEMEDEMMALLKVALLCLAQLPKDRPMMSEVHKMIDEIRRKGSKRGGERKDVELSSDRSSPSSLVDTTPNFIST